MADSIDSELYHYLQELHVFIEAQQKKVKKLEKNVKDLQTDLGQLKQQPPLSVQYKFDQLKVERLEGTLNIGLTPNASGMVEQYSVDGNIKEDVPLPIVGEQQGVTKEIKEEIEEYLKQDVLSEIHQLEGKYGYTLDDSYQQLVIDDIRKQLDKQIELYLNKTEKSIVNGNTTALKDNISEKVIQDINHALESFIKHMPRKEEK